MRSCSVRALALVLALSTAWTGCAAGGLRRARVSEPADLACAGPERRGPASPCGREAGGLATVSYGAPEDGALEPVRHRHAWRWAVVGIAIPLIVLVDLVILPYTARHHRHFTCTRTVVVWCSG